MADKIRATHESPADIQEKWKDLGDGTYAKYIALEPASIGGGGSATIGSVLQGARDVTADSWYSLLRTNAGVAYDARDRNWTITETVPVSFAGGVDVTDRVARLLGHVTVDNATLAATQSGAWAVTVSNATLAVTQSGVWTNDVNDRAARLLGVIYGSQGAQLKQSATNFNSVVELAVGASLIDPRDISDRAARLLGHVTVDNASLAVTGPLTDTQLRASAVPVSGAFFQATQPVSLATNTPDVTDRAARLLGHVTVDNATLAVTQSGTWTVQQGTPPWTVKGDQARASATIPNPVVTGLRAATYPTKPTAVTAGQLVDMVGDVEGVIYTRPRQLNTFTALYRLALAAASSKLAFTFVANTDKQLATIHHANTATKTVRIRRVWVQIISTGAVAGEVQLELRRLSATTQPATGNPAITPVNRDPGGAAVEATCLALPTTAASEFNANAPIASSIVNLAASAGTASGTGLVPGDPGWIRLYDEASADDEEMAPVIRAGNTEGYAVIGRSTAAVPLNFIVRIVFTEE